MANPDQRDTPEQAIWDVNSAAHETWRAKNGDPPRPSEYDPGSRPT